jgi:hypothetical protein
MPLVVARMAVMVVAEEPLFSSRRFTETLCITLVVRGCIPPLGGIKVVAQIASAAKVMIS